MKEHPMRQIVYQCFQHERMQEFDEGDIRPVVNLSFIVGFPMEDYADEHGSSSLDAIEADANRLPYEGEIVARIDDQVKLVKFYRVTNVG